MRATTCAAFFWCSGRSGLRCAASGALPPTGPSCSSGSSLLALPAPAPAHDVAVGLLVLLARAVAQGRHAPWRDGVATRRRGALATAVRVVDRVHRRAARLRTHAHVPLASRLTHLHVLVVGVADRAHGGAALGAHH